MDLARLMTARPMTARLMTAGHSFGRVAVYSLRRFHADRGPSVAAALSYSSLLAMVPLLAISLAVLSAFPTFEQLRFDLQVMLFDSVMPSAGLAISDTVAEFVENASKATGAGIVGLAVTAVLLLNTITGGFNAIWRVTEARPLALRILVYWSLLTLGPLLLGASFSLSTYAFAVVQWSGVEDYTGPLIGLARLVPPVLSIVAFTLLFFAVPNRPVRLPHAFVGALITGILIEALKTAFGLYLEFFPSYQAIYGALAAIPIFLVWMYLSWAVVLLGAEITASLPEWRAAAARGQHAHDTGTRLALALTILSRLRAAQSDGRLPREAALGRGLPATLEELDRVLRALRRGGFAARGGGGRWVLSRDLSSASLSQLVTALGLAMEPGEGWPEQVRAAIAGLAAAGAEAGSVPLAELLDGADS